MNPILQDLQNKQWVWTATNATQPLSDKINQTTGFDTLDKALTGGFPRAGMIHLASPLGCGEIRLMLSILALQKKQNQQHTSIEQKLYAFINPPFELNAEFLLAHNIDLSQLVIIEATKQSSDALWSAEQCLKSGACEAVFVWQTHISHSHIRKLELAAQQGSSYCVWLEATGHISQQINTHKKTPNKQNLPLSLSLSLARENESLIIKVNKQKAGWAQKAVSIPLPFRTRSNHAFKQYLQSQPIANVVSIHANSHHAHR